MQNLQQKTRWIYLLTRLLDTPFWAIYNMLPLILYKSLAATPFQVALVISLKPAVSILSIYWSAQVNSRPDQLVKNILLARLFGCLPFLLFFTLPNVWLIIAAAGVYMAMAAGVVPAWMELLKRNIEESGRKQTFALGGALGYLGAGILPLVFGLLMDSYHNAWAWIFTVAGAISLSILLLQRLLKAKDSDCVVEDVIRPSIRGPWKHAFQLLKGDRHFLRFQIGSMVMSSGLMIMQPALPIYFIDKLGLSYFELSIAFALCKSVPYAIASPLWAQWLNRVDIFRFTATVTAIAALFPLLLFAASWQIAWIYFAYMVYGLMQAGSEMSWNMSGPLFAGEKDSAPYTSVNVVSVGIRGCFVPALGGMLCGYTSAPFVMILGVCLFLAAAYLFLHFRQQNRSALVQTVTD